MLRFCSAREESKVADAVEKPSIAWQEGELGWASCMHRILTHSGWDE